MALTLDSARQQLLDHFPADYFAARERFTALAGAHRARTDTYPIQARGPGGESLTIDTAYFGVPLPLRLLIVSSATHGAEGFTGSALQQCFIRDLVDAPSMPDRCGALFVHAVNPYGFAHLRRANENNVDLNRNCLQNFPGPANAAYAAFDALLNPRSPPRKDLFALRLLWRGLRFGPRTARAAIAGGQYVFQRGLFFGGAKKEESIAVFERVLRTPAYSRVVAVLHIDLHTGLGKYGTYKLFSHLREDLPEFRQLQEWFGARAVATSFAKSSGTYSATGLIGSVTQTVFDSARVYTTTLEFGTYSLLRVLAPLRNENWFHQYGTMDSTMGQRVKAQFLETFCPQDEAWRLAVLEQGGKVFRQAMAGLFNQKL